MAIAHTLFSRWTGKALGATAALIFAPAPPALGWWLLTGIVLGHVLDTMGFDVTDQDDADDAGDDLLAPAGVRFVFAALGRIAAASATVAREHVRCAERLMARLAFTPERRREALRWFHAGQAGAFPFDAVHHACRAELSDHPVLRELAMDSLCRMCALADTARATAELLELGERLGIAADDLARGLAERRTELRPEAPATPPAADG